MNRRKFIVGAVGLVLPPRALAQQSDRLRRIAVFIGATKENDPEAVARITALREGLEALGWTEGRNLQIEYRFGGGDTARIQSFAAELVNSAPDVIVANSSPVVAALKEATRTIPIIFAVVNDPVAQGFIPNLAQPGGNITGFTLIDFPMLGKWLEWRWCLALTGLRSFSTQTLRRITPFICVSLMRYQRRWPLSSWLCRCIAKWRSKAGSQHSCAAAHVPD